MIYDVAIAGLGAMGSAIAAHCAARGASVVGLEQFGPANELGSSSGKSRMIRKAYFEDPAYVPLLLRTYELWHELEGESGEELLQITGLLMVGKEDSEIIAGAHRAAREHNLPIESLSQRQIEALYPTLQVHDGEVGVVEPDGGVLAPEQAIRAQLKKATISGAELHFGVAMDKWHASEKGFEIYLG